MRALIDALGLVKAERFVVAINRERFDYTTWRQQGLPDLSIAQIAARNKCPITFRRFALYGAPIMVVSVAMCNLYLYLRYFVFL